MTDLQLPSAYEAEQKLLGCFLRDSGSYAKVGAMIHSKDFYNKQHNLIYLAIIRLAEKQIDPEIVNVADKLEKWNKLKYTGGRAYLVELAGMVVGAAGIVGYAEIVKEKSQYRQLINTANQVVRSAYLQEQSVSELVSILSQEAVSILKTEDGVGFKKLSDYTLQAGMTVEEYASGRLRGITTGFQSLDDLFGGFQRKEYIIIAARPQHGKAQPNDAPILTPNGWCKMGDLEIGDYVFNSQGRKTKILNIFPQGLKDVFKVNFNDGASVECCEDHLWYTTTRQDRKAGRIGTAKSTREISKTISGLYPPNRLNHQVPRIRPVEFSEKKFPVEPYVLGALLGDGSLARNSLMLSTADIFITDQVEQNTDCSVVWRRQFDYGLVTPRGRPNLLLNGIKELGLHGTKSGTKFIPKNYLLGSIRQRTRLLQGLMDTDGTINSFTSCEYSTISEQLCNGVVEIVRSLGGRATFSTRDTFYTHKGEKKVGRTSYRVYINFINGIIPFLLPRKRNKYREPSRQRPHAIVSVEFSRKAECRCLLIDSPTHLYVAQDYVLTHNTALTYQMGAKQAQNGSKVAYFSAETAGEEFAIRALCAEAKVDSLEWKKGILQSEQTDRITFQMTQIVGWPFWICEAPRIEINMLCTLAAQLHKEVGLNIIYVDYIQLLRTSERFRDRRDMIDYISVSLKHLAQRLNVPVVVCCQLSREIEKRRNKEPQLSDLKESGGLEQDADIVIMPQRLKLVAPRKEDRKSNLVTLYVRKCRNGPTGQIDLIFEEKYTRFEEFETSELPF